MIAVYLLIGGLALIAAMFWCDRAAQITTRQRHRLLNHISRQRDPRGLSREFDAVSHGRHYRAVLLCRDPAMLYSARLAAVLSSWGATS